MQMIRHVWWLVGVLLLAGCTVGTRYKRPSVGLPGEYRVPFPTPTQPSSLSIAEQKWWDVFSDAQLQALIRAALANNLDLRIAGARILQARATLGITRADQLPSITAGT